jgi:hypothetical protein
MVKKARPVGPLLFCLALFSYLPLIAQQTGDYKILQAEKKITIDGILEEWAGMEEWPVVLTPDGKTLPPSPDLTVTVRFTFDAENFYAAVRVLDERIEFPTREGKDGDGIYLTFVDPSAGSGKSPFLTFGFSQIDKEPLAMLTNREGDAGPFSFVRDVQLKIVVDEGQKSASYEVAVPWKYIPAFRPFLHQKWGINLIYDDVDTGQKKVAQLVSDPDYDADPSRPRKGMPCLFIPRPSQVPEFQSSLSANHFYPEDQGTLNLAVNSPSAQQGWELRMVLSTPEEGSNSFKKGLAFDQGMNVLAFPIELAQKTTGIYELSLGVIDDKGALRYTEDRSFFLLDRQEFDSFGAKLSEVKKGELFQKDPVFRESLPTLEIRLQWIKEFMETAPAIADLELIQQWYQEVKELFRNVDGGRPALFPAGRIVRMAYRSETDGSLKPYSVLIPEWYDIKTPLPLLVTLAEGDRDERGAIFALVSNYFGPKVRREAGDIIVLAPKVTDPSGWYLGEAGQDVMNCIIHLKKLYSINGENIILDGFSKGGYGALRLALLNPGQFKAVIVRSAILVLPDEVKGDSIFDFLDRAKNLSVLIVHGDQDKTAPVEAARNIAARLQELKMNFKYIEAKGGGHGDYNKWSDIFAWVKDVLGNAVVVTKPPKKRPGEGREKRE